MAAIDKLHLKDYVDLDNLRRWALIYYPKLFTYFYSDAITMNEKEFSSYKKSYARGTYKALQQQWHRFSSDGTVNAAIAYLKETYNMSESDAVYDANEAYKDYKKSIGQLEDSTALTIMNTPCKVDKKLKWICPLPCIREYLQNQCGVKERWYYKLFWKGKKHFSL